MLERLARKHFERGRQFELQDREDEAMEEFQRACELEPSFADPFLSLGRIKALRGQLREAVALFDSAVERSDDPQIRQWRGYVYGRLRKYREALADYHAADDGSDENIKTNIARMLLALGRFDEASEALVNIDTPSATQLRSALPRYTEFVDEPSDDARAIRYLFGGTLVLGTLGDGGIRLSNDRYLLLSEQHVAETLKRFVRFSTRRRWYFDGVAGEGAHHAPIAMAMAKILDIPYVTSPQPHTSILLCSAVIKGPVEAVRLVKKWRDANVQVMHFCVGLEPTGDPSEKEPEVIGSVHRCAVPWYRVEPYSRLEPELDVGDDSDSPWPGFRIGPATVDPNSERVASGLLEAYGQNEDGSIMDLLLRWYSRHSRVRAFDWT